MPPVQTGCTRCGRAIAIRFQLDYNQMITDWAAWAVTQTDTWNDATDSGAWDWRSALTPGDVNPK